MLPRSRIATPGLCRYRRGGNASRPEGEAPLPSQSTAPVFQLSGACRGFASRSGGGQANSLPPLVAAGALCPRSKRAARGCGETADERIRGFQRLFSTGTWCVSAPSGRAIVRCGGERGRKQSPRPRSGEGWARGTKERTPTSCRSCLRRSTCSLRRPWRGLSARRSSPRSGRARVSSSPRGRSTRRSAGSWWPRPEAPDR
jgi:hypothetical protein